MAAAIERGDFDEARRLVEELARMTPDSPQVPVMNETIDRAQAAAQRTAREVADAVDRGEFTRSRALVAELAAIVPRSGRLAELESIIERARAAASAAERKALDAVAKALAAVDRGDHDARTASVEAARGYVAELASVTPRSRRVTELEGEIDRAELVPAMVRIRDGRFRMKIGGHYTRIAVKGFRFGKYEVTFRRIRPLCRRDAPEETGRRGLGPRAPSGHQRELEGGKRHMCSGCRTSLGTRYRLPTAAEWEYAARAGSTTEYPWGKKVGKNRANCKGCGSQWDRRQTAPVGSFHGNAWGLHDIVGNVYEWTCSTHATDYAARECTADKNWEEDKDAKKDSLMGLFQKKANSRVSAWRILEARRITTADLQGEQARADAQLRDDRLPSRFRLSVRRIQLSARATRKPLALNRMPVVPLSRVEERTPPGPSSHEPPRSTRRLQFPPSVQALPSRGASP